MLRLSHRKMIMAAGLIWMACGALLLCLGFQRIGLAARLFEAGESAPILHALSGFMGGGYNAAVALMAVGLCLGFIKGRTVLARAMRRTVARIRALPDPSPFSKLYGWKYLALLGLMIGLGVLMKLLHAPLELRGSVLVAVGAGLSNTSVVALRSLSES